MQLCVLCCVLLIQCGISTTEYSQCCNSTTEYSQCGISTTEYSQCCNSTTEYSQCGISTTEYSQSLLLILLLLQYSFLLLLLSFFNGSCQRVHERTIARLRGSEREETLSKARRIAIFTYSNNNNLFSPTIIAPLCRPEGRRSVSHVPAPETRRETPDCDVQDEAAGERPPTSGCLRPEALLLLLVHFTRVPPDGLSPPP
ncbi:hypothetical protein EYF80_043884 [Liparis tanakae]|uniref:Uncharacterized protein n=1 Tax=Liparis tanakae TaxID=230148 RepID=A0A4Z2FYF5_9TELE|nr:hypothetical protein EYF80_043884 [Liparis tanakae]